MDSGLALRNDGLDFRQQAPLARTAEFVETDQCDSTGPVLFAKIFLFPLTPNQIYNSRHPVPQGRIAIVTDAGRDAAAFGARRIAGRV
jgi:hypothetical protein